MKDKPTSPLRSIKIDDNDIHILSTSNLKEWQEAVSRETKKDVLSERELRLKDITWKLNNRDDLKTFLMRLLVAQNVVVFSLVTYALIFDKMKDLQLIFSTLVGGTLAETAAAIYIMTRWLFSDIKYDKQAIHDGK